MRAPIAGRMGLSARAHQRWALLERWRAQCSTTTTASTIPHIERRGISAEFVNGRIVSTSARFPEPCSIPAVALTKAHPLEGQ